MSSGRVLNTWSVQFWLDSSVWSSLKALWQTSQRCLMAFYWESLLCSWGTILLSFWKVFLWRAFLLKWCLNNRGVSCFVAQPTLPIESSVFHNYFSVLQRAPLFLSWIAVWIGGSCIHACVYIKHVFAQSQWGKQSEATVYLCKCIAHCFSFFSLEDVAVFSPSNSCSVDIICRSVRLSVGEVWSGGKCVGKM